MKYTPMANENPDVIIWPIKAEPQTIQDRPPSRVFIFTKAYVTRNELVFLQIPGYIYLT